MVGVRNAGRQVDINVRLLYQLLINVTRSSRSFEMFSEFTCIVSKDNLLSLSDMTGFRNVAC